MAQWISVRDLLRTLEHWADLAQRAFGSEEARLHGRGGLQLHQPRLLLVRHRKCNLVYQRIDERRLIIPLLALQANFYIFFVILTTSLEDKSFHIKGINVLNVLCQVGRFLSILFSALGR